jgi:hypothetical protein
MTLKYYKYVVIIKLFTKMIINNITIGSRNLEKKIILFINGLKKLEEIN